jgi:uncharacterized membrane protein YdjX (TVP38/TMEM64 family)
VPYPVRRMTESLNHPTDEAPPPTGGRRRDLRLVASAAVGLLWISAPPITGTYLLVKLGAIGDILRQDLTLGFWAYVAVFALSAGLGVLPTYAQAILGGWVFGMWAGLGGALIGFTGGAAIGMLFSRFIAGESVVRSIDRNARAAAVRKALVGCGALRTFCMVSLVRIPPNSPFAITNLALGTTGVNIWVALAGTFIGMLPRTAIACYFASSASATGAEDIQQLIEDKGISTVVVGVAVMAVCVLIIGRVAKAALDRVALEGRP